mgnify:CR=1 FL=1
MDKLTQTAKILKRLKENGKITNADLWNMRIQRGSERIRELKSEGHIIKSVQNNKTLWTYVYMGHEDEEED